MHILLYVFLFIMCCVALSYTNIRPPIAMHEHDCNNDDADYLNMLCCSLMLRGIDDSIQRRQLVVDYRSIGLLSACNMQLSIESI